jgi:sarcosine oxidase subunit beta
MSSLPRSADIVIIGGGIIGSSIAWHLTEAGCRDVVVLERESAPGKGSTGKSMGGVRVQFATPVNIQMSQYSIRFYAEFDERLGHPAGYRAQGYLFLATQPAHLAYIRGNHAMYRMMNVESVRWVERAEIAREYPQLRTDDVLGGSFGAEDGFVDPYSAMTGFMRQAMERGARLVKEAEVTEIACDQGSFAVKTTQGVIAARTLVNAGGAWSAGVAKMLEVALPVEPLRRMLVPTEPFDTFPHTAPMIIDMSNGFHFRPEGRGFLLAWNDPEETPGYKQEVEPGFLEKILTRAAERVPVFAEVPVNPKRVWAGLYEMTPDHHPIIGPTEVPGFFVVAGFSGHGVMHAPAAGKLAADLILKGRSDVVSDPAVFSIERFKTGKLLHESAVL